MLQVVAQVDETPDLIEREEKSLPKLLPLGGRPRCLARTVLEYNFGLPEMAAQCCARAEEDQRSVGDPSIDDQLRIRQESVEGTRGDIRVGRLALPKLPQDLARGRIEVNLAGFHADLRREIRPGLLVDTTELLIRHRHEGVPGTHPE